MRRMLWFVCAGVAATAVSVVASSAAGSWPQARPGKSAVQKEAPQAQPATGAAKPDSTKPDAAKDLPPGPGRDTVVRACSGCHVLSTVTTQRKSESAWTDTVIEMRNRGADASDDDLEAVVEYLVRNFGPPGALVRININNAATSEIAAGLSVPRAEAEAIVAYRTKNGKFKDADSVKQVPGIEAARIDAARDRIDF